ncbi:hypothetical protein RIF29_06318 [Crotalaria pallida]|uniref:Uncharacterized protein n=1 Tax=Crotalaria pallida TaxID=3830 RepID=A0AAN9J3V4_CROPI
MKKTSVILAFFFTCLLIGITAGADPEPVLDTSGKKVRPGIKYYILPASIGSGGLTLINPDNTCPLYVVQEKSLYSGKPVTFSSYGSKDEILTSTDLNVTSIVKQATTSCNKTLQWSLRKAVPGVWFAVAGDEFSEVTVSTVHIDKFGTEGYVLSFCSDLCPTCPIVCNKLGLYEAEDGYKHLAQNYQIQPYPFKFKRA